MQLPLVSRNRYTEMLCLKNQQIARLEAERRLLWDKLSLIGIGAPVFSATPKEPPPNVPAAQALKPIRTSSARPSTIMRRMDRIMELRWVKKNLAGSSSMPDSQ